MAKKTLYFNELTVIEILSFIEQQFCDRKHNYSHYDNLRKAWEVLWENESDYDALCNVIGLATDNKSMYKRLAAQWYPFLDGDVVSLAKLEETIEKMVPIAWTKADESTTNTERQYKIFEKALFDYLKARFDRNCDTWNMVLVRKRKKA